METNLCVAGFGGQGVLFAGKLIAYAGLLEDREVSWLPSYGPEMRGGTANCFVVISDEAIGAPLGDVMDDLIVMNGPSLKKFIGTLKSGGTLFINSSIVSDDIGRDGVYKACLHFSLSRYQRQNHQRKPLLLSFFLILSMPQKPYPEPVFCGCPLFHRLLQERFL